MFEWERHLKDEPTFDSPLYYDSGHGFCRFET